MPKIIGHMSSHTSRVARHVTNNFYVRTTKRFCGSVLAIALNLFISKCYFAIGIFSRSRDKTTLSRYELCSLYRFSLNNNAVTKEEKLVFKFLELTKKDNYLKDDWTWRD